MGSKRDRNKAKREAKAGKVLMPKQTPFTNLVPVLKPAFRTRNEDPHDTHVKFYAALTSLENSRGTTEGFQLLYTRLNFGRIIAMDYFTDEVAEHIHYAIGNLIIMLDTQAMDEESTTMSITPEIATEVHESLEMIDDMTGKISPLEYEMAGVKLINLMQMDGTASEYNLIEWDEFKERETKSK